MALRPHVPSHGWETSASGTSKRMDTTKPLAVVTGAEPGSAPKN